MGGNEHVKRSDWCTSYFQGRSDDPKGLCRSLVKLDNPHFTEQQVEFLVIFSLPLALLGAVAQLSDNDGTENKVVRVVITDSFSYQRKPTVEKVDADICIEQKFHSKLGAGSELSKSCG